MSACFECTIGVAHNGDAIGVCSVCSSLGCPNHGGKPRGQPRFVCSGCIVGLVTVSSGGSPPPPGGTGGGGQPATPPTNGGGGGGSSAADATSTFTSTLDFELQLPVLAVASERWRRSIRPESLRRAVRKMFGLLDDPAERSELLARAADELREPVRDQVARQLRNSDQSRELLEGRGNLSQQTEAGVQEITERIRQFLEHELRDWMQRIHPTLNMEFWIGDRDRSQGVIDLLLLGDALGLNAYVWNVDPSQSPFRRLDMVARGDLGLLILGELYAQSAPAVAGSV